MITKKPVQFYRHNSFPLLLVFFALAINSQAQEVNTTLQISNAFNEAEVVYGDSSIQHTIWKPVIYGDSIVQLNKNISWFKRKFFNEHLLDIKQPGYQIKADVIFDMYIGKSKRYVETPTMNTRGYEVSGTVGHNFYFETAFYENQGRFGGYIDSFIRKNKVVPGQGGFRNFGDGKGFDFSYTTSRLIYTPGKHLAFDLGYGKHFIGDGYRSLILGDAGFSYPYFKTTFTAGKLQYNAMWSEYICDRNSNYNNKQGFFRKWSQTFVLDWKATSKLSLGIFETVMWPNQDSSRDTDITPWLASPIMFVHGATAPSGLHNNIMAGGTVSYQLSKQTKLYGQLVLDHMGTKGSWERRYGLQAGIRSNNIFKLPHLNGLLEYNQASPYMYATTSLFINYAHDNQPLAHPLGANFREVFGLLQYSYKQWQFRLSGFVAKYGADSSKTANYGHDVFKPLQTHSTTSNVSIGDGMAAHILYAEARLAYLLNPATNMRLETGFTFRNEKSNAFNYQDRIFYIGIRMSFHKISYEY
jgi:hypothetical protein